MEEGVLTPHPIVPRAGRRRSGVRVIARSPLWRVVVCVLFAGLPCGMSAAEVPSEAVTAQVQETPADDVEAPPAEIEAVEPQASIEAQESAGPPPGVEIIRVRGRSLSAIETDVP